MPTSDLPPANSGDVTQARPLVIGEALWDVFPDSTLLGGAPLNFAIHARRMGHAPLLISAVGEDDLGRRAVREIQSLGLDISLLQRVEHLPTGCAYVSVDPRGQAVFRIERPAAYDGVILSAEEIQTIRRWSPDWLYFGTLFSSRQESRAILLELLRLVPDATRFYDVNLRSGFDSLPLVGELLDQAEVVKMNQDEMHAIRRQFALPAKTEAFCAAASKRFGLNALCVTLGSHGCAIFANEEYTEHSGYYIEVADTVGAGDAFAAAFLHGLASKWDVAKIASFANRVGALVASKPGAVPDWTPKEVAAL